MADSGGGTGANRNRRRTDSGGSGDCGVALRQPGQCQPEGLTLTCVMAGKSAVFTLFFHHVWLKDLNPVAIRVFNKRQSLHFAVVRYFHKLDPEFMTAPAGVLHFWSSKVTMAELLRMIVSSQVGAVRFVLCALVVGQLRHGFPAEGVGGPGASVDRYQQRLFFIELAREIRGEL